MLTAPWTTDSFADDFAAFVTASPSSYHAAAEVARRLAEAGFERRDETAAWGGGADPVRAVVVRDGAVIAWRHAGGVAPTTPVRILGGHTDSPGFKLKPKPTRNAEGWFQAGVEVYGGPLLNSWLDRDLELAGRLVTRDGAEHLVRTGPIARIPQLAIHLDREANQGLTLDPQQHTQPVLGLFGDGADVLGLLAERAGIAATDIAGTDVFTVDSQAPARLGAERELFASPRLDNLISVYAGMRALIAAEDSAEHISVFAGFDHE
ncbi:M18 family aminopeptidase, partial [Leucobacter sp. M11]|nr:M18 family aminopeptidase [Leucobacter sp. M11]